MKSTKKISHKIHLPLLGTLFFLCVYLGAVATTYSQSTPQPVGVFLTIPGKYEIFGAIKTREWRWDAREKAWWGNLVTIKITGALNKTWKKFGLANFGRQFEVSGRTRGSLTYPVRIFVHGYSNHQRPGDLILKKQVSVSASPGRFFQFNAGDFLLVGKPLTRMSFALSRLPFKNVNVPAVRLNSEKKAAKPIETATSKLTGRKEGLKRAKPDLAKVNKNITIMKARIEVLKQRINSERKKHKKIPVRVSFNKFTVRALNLKSKLQSLESQLEQNIKNSKKIDKNIFKLELFKLKKNLDQLEAQVGNYSKNLKNKTRSQTSSLQKKTKVGTLSKKKNVPRRTAKVTKKSKATKSNEKKKTSPSTRRKKLQTRKTAKNPPFLLQLSEKLKPVQEKTNPYLQSWAPGLAAIPALALSRVLVVFVITLLGAFAGSLYHRSQMKVFYQDPVNMKKSLPLISAEKSVRMLENSFLTLTVLLLSSVYLAMLLQVVLTDKNFTTPAMIVCFLIAFFAGKRLKWASSIFFTTFVVLINLLLFGTKDLLPEGFLRISPNFFSQVADSTAAIFGLGIFTCGIWWMATKEPQKKNRLAHVNTLLLVIFFSFWLTKMSVLLPLAMLAISLLWFLFLRFFQKRRLLPKTLHWLGLAYVRLNKWGDLEKIIKKLDNLKKADALKVAWLKANLYDHTGKNSDAIRILEDLSPSLRCDQLLLKLYARVGNYPAIEKRVALHRRDDAVTLLKKLPQTDIRDVLILNQLIKENAWEEISKFLAGMKKSKAISALEKLPSSSERDDQLILLLFQNGQFDKILEAIESYSVSEGVTKLRALLPAGQVCEGLVVHFMVRQGEYNQVRQLIFEIPTEKAVSILLKLPSSFERDRLLAELWVNAGEIENLLNFISDLESEYGIEILTQLNPGIIRDRALASIYAQNNQHQDVVDCLEKHYGQGQLPAPDLCLLARSYTKLGKDQESVQALEAAWCLDMSDEELLQELCRSSLQAGHPSRHLAELGDDVLNSLSADGLWALVEYHQQFNRMDMAKKAAEISIKNHKDQRAVFYLGGLLEETGDFQKAAEIYAVAGKDGNFHQAMCLFQLQDYEGTSHLLKNSEKTDQNKSALSYHLGYSLMRTGKLENALTVFEEMNEIQHDEGLQKDAAILCSRIGASRMAKKKYEDAIEFFEKSLRYAPESASQEIQKIKDSLAIANYNLALVNSIKGENGSQAVLQFIAKANEHRPGPWPELDFLRGVNLLSDKGAEKALQTFSVLSKRYPDNPQYLFHKALAASIEHKDEYAASILNDLLTMEKNTVYENRAKILLGILELNKGNLKAAEKQFRTVSQLG